MVQNFELPDFYTNCYYGIVFSQKFTAHTKSFKRKKDKFCGFGIKMGVTLANFFIEGDKRNVTLTSKYRFPWYKQYFYNMNSTCGANACLF